jgi:hypothetical protein
MTGPLAERLEALCLRYDRPEALALDPLAVPLAYPDPLDREVAAFVAAHLAYGRVAPMLKAIRSLMAVLGPRPALRLREGGEADLLGSLEGALAAWK